MADPKYLMVKKKFTIAWLITFVSLVLLVLASMQFALWIDSRSNQRWCEIVELFNQSYREAPPTTDTGRKIAAAMDKLPTEFECR